ncbi:MAG: DUF692 family protein [Saprospiraceae bacterium]|nr:DUF692 family protein [Saprospiraceae bacterium]
MLYPSIACNLDSDILLTALPLLESERVQGLEWSFDTLYQVRDIPAWFDELLLEYGRAGRLVGHGVFFSLFSGRWSPEQAQWLKRLKKQCDIFHFDHITEHFGFMTGADFHSGAPISLPFTASTLAIGHDRLRRIQEVCACPVGLENLAFAYSVEEVKRHGDFLNKLMEPVNGFIILDLHNLYCQAHNFDIPADELLPLYPLDRVREIHISGGSWENSSLLPDRPVRRDTHDDAVPQEVFQLLKNTIPLCPNLKFVVLEQMGTALHTEASRRQFRQDFDTMHTILEAYESPDNYSGNAFIPLPFPALGAPLEDADLHRQQRQLSEILEKAGSFEEAQRLLAVSDLAGTAWGTEHWAPYMLETATRIAQKWQKGFRQPE